MTYRWNYHRDLKWMTKLTVAATCARHGSWDSQPIGTAKVSEPSSMGLARVCDVIVTVAWHRAVGIANGIRHAHATANHNTTLSRTGTVAINLATDYST